MLVAPNSQNLVRFQISIDTHPKKKKKKDKKEYHSISFHLSPWKMFSHQFWAKDNYVDNVFEATFEFDTDFYENVYFGYAIHM